MYPKKSIAIPVDDDDDVIEVILAVSRLDTWTSRPLRG